MQVFIAGVMQGERLDKYIYEQDYRLSITKCIETHIPNADITDPWALNKNSVDYDEHLARETFHSMTLKAGEADLLIAYLPTVSMGTAMEMWQAYQAGAYIVAVTPHVHHWAIRFTADEILPDLQTLLREIESGQLVEAVRRRGAVDAPPDAV